MQSPSSSKQTVTKHKQKSADILNTPFGKMWLAQLKKQAELALSDNLEMDSQTREFYRNIGWLEPAGTVHLSERADATYKVRLAGSNTVIHFSKHSIAGLKLGSNIYDQL